MKKLVSLINLLFDTLKYSCKDLYILPGDNLKRVFIFTVAIAGFSIISTLLKVATFIDWRGSIGGVAVVGTLYFTGRRKDSALSRSHGTNVSHQGINTDSDKGSSNQSESAGNEGYDISDNDITAERD